MKIDPNNTPYQLASNVAELIKTLKITPHASFKLLLFEMHMGRKLTSNLAITIIKNNQGWEIVKLAK